MTDLNKKRELELFNAFVKENLPELFEKHSNGNFFAKVTYDSMFGAWLGAKAQAVPDTHIVVPRTRKVVVAIEKMVEQQVEASGITSDVFRLDGWRILDAIQEAIESGAEG
ncbi:TPA: hypothetical protein U9I93_003957 [Acinetobacter baumannii]|nr:hypothetical protein [Acinetobacter baumannii]HEN9537590.1 hypothetical protein [Acinetobacter baumannii]